jgi:hypothetical protein
MIPRIVHQTYPSKDLPEALRKNVERLRALNPGWSIRLYDDADIHEFISREYGAAVLDRYLRISPVYGAARADLFRYLLIYRLGGVYLDIKSMADHPLDDILGRDDRFILSQWDNAPEGLHPRWGLHPDLPHVPGGEFQQWFIATVPGHPFIKAVIDHVLHRIDTYNPYRDGVGLEVVRLTGPVAYTLAIAPLLEHHPHRRVANEAELGLRYSTMNYHAHHAFFSRHYSKQMIPIVGPAGSWVARVRLAAYTMVRRLAARIAKRLRTLPARLRATG